ncbi:helix-turn-helix domain-containing protein [Microvirga vignae]|uniref:helix-turn-helix transcriptional regulator n=1 Tax=Microvirga vignae TaxID=1225564 RepID=UPI003CC7AF89
MRFRGCSLKVRYARLFGRSKIHGQSSYQFREPATGLGQHKGGRSRTTAGATHELFDHRSSIRDGRAQSCRRLIPCAAWLARGKCYCGRESNKPTDLRLTHEVKRWLGEHTNPRAKTSPHKRTHPTKTHPIPEREYIPLSAAAKRLGFSRRTIYYQVRQGKIPGAIQIAGSWRIRIADLDQHLAQLPAGRGEQIDPVTCLAKPKAPEIVREPRTEYESRLEMHFAGIVHPLPLSRPVPELRRAVEDGSTTEAMRGELNT